jgi:tetratricopeptide (TPR) repeat protein
MWKNNIQSILNLKSKYLVLAVLLMLVSSGFLAYWPGIGGPFVFDDFSNIVDNSFLRLPDLTTGSLVNAATSTESGPLKRPIPMVSFALNYYFSGNSNNPFPFKVTNVLIHVINSMLIFAVFYLGIVRAFSKDPVFNRSASSNQYALIVSGSAALLWLLHPIHLTSVLYVVQRMASLSAMFVLSAIVVYLYGRSVAVAGKPLLGWTTAIAGTVIFGLLGLLSKENAALLPLYLLLIEFTLFRSEFPLVLLDKLDQRKKMLLLAFVLALVAIVISYAVAYSLPGYANRTFTFTERVLSQPRILLFYLSLIFFPRNDKFGIFHDDIALSTGILDPWTTLPSLLIVMGLIALAFLLYDRHKILTLAILWFFVSHLMESTFYPLEPAHEHRNYLAAIGPIIAIFYLSGIAVHRIGDRRIWWLPLLFLALFLLNTPLRAWHWSDLASLHVFEASNHPNSARAQSSLGSMFAKAGQLEKAKESFLRASELRPHDVSDLINIRIILAWQHRNPPAQLLQDINQRVHHGQLSPLTNQVLDYAVNCAQTDCAAIQDDLLVWLPVYIERASKRHRLAAHYNYLYARILLLKGRTNDAIVALNTAISVYSRLLHPYFLLAEVYLRNGDLAMSEQILEKLRVANRGNPYPRDRELKILSDRIQAIKSTR